MELRALGTTGIRVSLLGLGAVKFGRSTNLKYPHAFALPSDAELRRLLAEARELGVNLIDTAPAYGESEARIGALLPGARNDWILATKVGEHFDGTHSRFDFTAARVHASVGESLRHLRTDHLDIVQVHANDDDLHVLEHTDCVTALVRLRERGVVRAIGFSAKTLAGGLAALRVCDLVMVTLAPDDLAAMPIVAAAQREGRGVLIKKALDSGHLPAAERSRHFAWLRALPGVSSVVVGTLDPLHLRANAESLAP